MSHPPYQKDLIGSALFATQSIACFRKKLYREPSSKIYKFRFNLISCDKFSARLNLTLVNSPLTK